MTSKVRTTVLVISDTHGMDFSSRSLVADVAIHCGDLTDESKLEEFRTTIRSLQQIKAPLKLVIAGNHDFTLDQTAFQQKVSEVIPPLDPELVAREYGHLGQAEELFQQASDAGIILLHEGNYQFTLANGALLSMYASPYAPSLGGWGFQYTPGHDHDFSIANNTAIVVTHGPPQGVLDYTYASVRAGCPKLFAAVAQAKPQIHCFGHIHEGWGARQVVWRDIYGETPTHFTAIDNDKSAFVEKLSTLNPSRFDDNHDILTKQEKMKRYVEEGCIEVDIQSCRNELFEPAHTLFVNASMTGEGDLSHLPWILHVDLPAICSDFA